VTLVADIAALSVAPLTLVLFTYRLLYTTELTPMGIVCAEVPLKLNVLVVPGVRVPTLLRIVKDPRRLNVPAPPDMMV
jgi:hypothetical protein